MDYRPLVEHNEIVQKTISIYNTSSLTRDTVFNCIRDTYTGSVSFNGNIGKLVTKINKLYSLDNTPMLNDGKLVILCAFEQSYIELTINQQYLYKAKLSCNNDESYTFRIHDNVLAKMEKIPSQIIDESLTYIITVGQFDYIKPNFIGIVENLIICEECETNNIKPIEEDQDLLDQTISGASTETEQTDSEGDPVDTNVDHFSYN